LQQTALLLLFLEHFSEYLVSFPNLFACLAHEFNCVDQQQTATVTATVSAASCQWASPKQQAWPDALCSPRVNGPNAGQSACQQSVISSRFDYKHLEQHSVCWLIKCLALAAGQQHMLGRPADERTL